MSDDMLERATAALRDTTSTPPDDAARQRAKLLAQAAKRAKPAPIWQWAAAAFAVLFVSSAMAQLGGYIPAILRVLTREQAPAEQPRKAVKRAPPSAAGPALTAPPPSAAPAAAPARSAAAPSEAQPPSAASGGKPARSPNAEPSAARVGSAPAPVIEAKEPTPAAAHAQPPSATQPAASAAIKPAASATPSAAMKPAASPPPSAATTIATPSATKPAASATPSAATTIATPSTATKPAASPPPSAATPAPPPAEPAELALFRRAERLHLARAPEALAAWDAYLHVATQGTLVPEARYNRALCLVRLHRYGEARRALEPFAAGAYAGYRQREAKALLARIPD